MIGFAFAINNELNSADIYASNEMFRRFWPRLLKTAAIEAVAERVSSGTQEVVSINTTSEFLTKSEQGFESLNEVTKRTHMLKREAEKSIFFETRDMTKQGTCRYGFAQKVRFSLRSRRKHKAWGVSPRKQD